MKNEIKIAHVHLETPLLVSEKFVQLLIIENANEFYKTVTELEACFENGEGSFIFSSKEQIINPAKSGVMVLDLFHLDLNDKKIINLLYKKLEKEVFAKRVSLLNQLNSKLTEFLEETFVSAPFALDYDEIQPIDYFKVAGVKFQKDYTSIEEKIVCYVNTLIELKNCEFFVFVNLKSILSDEKLQAIYKHCELEQVGLLLIESSKIRPLLENEKAIIITEDLCEILENYDDL